MDKELFRYADSLDRQKFWILRHSHINFGNEENEDDSASIATTENR